MRFDAISLFCEYFELLHQGISGRALKNGLISIHCWNPRDYTQDVHRTVDDKPYGGGPGMLMKYQPLADAVAAAKEQSAQSKVIYMSPQGRRLDQQLVNNYAEEDGLIIVSGRYLGVDERFIEAWVDDEVSIGDYVLSGGELPALVLMDAICRQLPGVLGHDDSAAQDSHMQGLLSCGYYTRPEVIDTMRLPDVLLSGDHKAINAWRKQQALIRTHQRRPDLLENRELSSEEQSVLDHFFSDSKFRKNEGE